MPKFKDKTGETWPLELTIGAAIRVNKESGGQFNLFEPEKGELHDRLFRDLPLFWELLCVLVEPEIIARGKSVEQFGELMAANELVAAQRLFLAEWSDFFRQLQQEAKAIVLEKFAAYHETAQELAANRLKGPLGKDLDDQIRQVMEKGLNQLSGDLQGKLDAILGDSPSANSG